MQSLAGLQQHAARERSSAKEAALRSRLNPAGVGSGLKGHDERRSAAPLTPLPTQKVKLCLDTADVVRDVKLFAPLPKFILHILHGLQTRIVGSLSVPVRYTKNREDF